MTTLPERTGGQLIVDCLQAQGVEHVFCVPGESYLAVLDALHDASINVELPDVTPSLDALRSFRAAGERR